MSVDLTMTIKRVMELISDAEKKFEAKPDEAAGVLKVIRNTEEAIKRNKDIGSDRPEKALVEESKAALIQARRYAFAGDFKAANRRAMAAWRLNFTAYWGNYEANLAKIDGRQEPAQIAMYGGFGTAGAAFGVILAIEVGTVSLLAAAKEGLTTYALGAPGLALRAGLPALFETGGATATNGLFLSAGVVSAAGLWNVAQQGLGMAYDLATTQNAALKNLEIDQAQVQTAMTHGAIQGSLQASVPGLMAAGERLSTKVLGRESATTAKRMIAQEILKLLPMAAVDSGAGAVQAVLSGGTAKEIAEAAAIGLGSNYVFRGLEAVLSNPRGLYKALRPDPVEVHRLAYEARRDSPERKALHETIVSDLLRQGTASEKPFLIFTAGAPGAGKSTTVKTLQLAGYIEADKALLLDPDLIKPMIPEYEALKKISAEDAAKIVHSESSKIMDQVFEQAVSQKKNLIVDGTLRWTEYTSNLIKRLRREHPEYSSISIVSVDAGLPTALARVKARAEQMGRYVPPEYVRETAELVAGSVKTLEPIVDFVVRMRNEDWPMITQLTRGGLAAGVSIFVPRGDGSDSVMVDPVYMRAMMFGGN